MNGTREQPGTASSRCSRLTRHAVWLAVAVAAAAVALAACDGSSGGSSPSSTSTSSAPAATVSKTATVTATPTGSASPGPTGSTSESPTAGSTAGQPGGQGGALADCRENQLRASLNPHAVKGASTGSYPSGKYAAVIVDFENTSDRACLLHGYPGAALENSSGKQVKQATRTIRGTLLGVPPGRNGEPTVTLRPGVFAAAGIEGVNHQEQGAAQAGCDATYPKILITPPNTRTPVPFAHAWPVCYSFDVHPVNYATSPSS